MYSDKQTELFNTSDDDFYEISEIVIGLDTQILSSKLNLGCSLCTMYLDDWSVCRSVLAKTVQSNDCFVAEK